MKVKEESENVASKLNIQKTKIMASGPITSWQTDAETMKRVTDFVFWGSKITVDGDCSHEIKKTLVRRKKSYDQSRQHIKKQRPYFASKCLSSQSNGFSSSHIWMWELDYKASLSTEELLRLNCGVEEDSWKSLGLQGDPTSPSQGKSVLNIQWKDWCWSWNSNTLVTWCKELTHLKTPWWWERLKAGGEGDDRGWDDWMASLTQCAWVWVNSRSWWMTGKPGMLQSVGSQRVGHNWATELTDWLVPWSKIQPWPLI